MVDKAIITCVINGKDISDKIKENLVSLTIVDYDGIKADTLDMTLTNYIKRPEGEDEIKIWINDAYYGIFIVNTTNTTDENLLIVKATSANFHKRLKEKQNVSYAETSLKEIVAQVAEAHGLELNFDFDDIEYEMLIKEKESDLHFLKRLADKYDAIFSIKNQTLIFRKRDESFPEFVVDVRECKPWNVKHIARKKYASCTASWRDTKENATLRESVEEGEPVLQITGSYLSVEDARLAAKGALAKSRRETKEGHFSKKGEYFSAGSTLLVVESLQDDGVYKISEVTTNVHKETGFRVSVQFKN